MAHSLALGSLAIKFIGGNYRLARKPVPDSEVQAIVKAEVQNADGYAASAVSGERSTNLDYYFCRPFGNELEGRSSVVDSSVRDTVEWIKPTLMRIFTAGDNVVEFEPEEESDVAGAKQATEYVNFIWSRDNHGFLNTLSWVHDGLLSKNGVVKIWWDDTEKTKRERYSGLPDDSFAMLVADKSVEVAEHTEHTTPTEIMRPDKSGALVPASVDIVTHDVVITRTMPGGRVCVEPMPPEEFLISKEARNIADARMVGHRTRVTLSELKEEGVDEEIINRLAGDDASVMTDAEEVKRNTVENATASSNTAINTTMRTVWRTEVYIKIDVDGDGIAEMRKVTCAGSAFEILSNEAWEGPRPFAGWSPIPMPHRYFGLAVADLIRDIQLIKSTIMRQYLDNLYLANNQREEVEASQIIDPDELLSSAPGRKIRVKRMGSIMPIPVPNVGDQALSGLAYIDQIKENRTGVSERTQGLNADALADETATASRIAMTAAMGKIELVARIFAETGFRDAFRLILKLICMYQDKPRTVRLTGGWTPMDPSSWNSDMDVQVHVALGTGDRDQQLLHAQMIGAMQEKAIQLGFVSPDNLKNTADIAANGMGYKSSERFFTFPDGEAAKQPIKLPPPNQKPGTDPQTLMQLEQVKAQAKVQATTIQAQARAQTDQHLNEVEAQREALQSKYDMALEQLKAASDERIAFGVAHIRNVGQITAAQIAAKATTDNAVLASEQSQEAA